MTTKTKPEPMLWLSDARGVYIPRDFANSFADRAKHVTGVTDDDWKILEAGPEHEFYWDAWTNVCDRAVITDKNGARYRIHQDGNCWLIPEDWEWSEDEGFFVKPSDAFEDSRDADV